MKARWKWALLGIIMEHGFVLRIPVVTFQTWNGNTLEGTGVEPDTVVEISRDGLREGRDAQIEHALQLLGVAKGR